jgi:hypothetical protein
MLSRGQSAIEFMAEVSIAKSTFFKWLDEQPEFKAAYDIGTVKAEAHWIKRGEDNLDNPDFNSVYYNRVMGSRFGISGSRKLRKKHICPDDESITVNQRLKNTIDSIADDEVGAEEVEKISNVFSKIADIDEKTELSEQVKMLMKEAGLENKP